MNDKIEFWIRTFKPRSQKWQKETLKRLKSKVSQFETLQENQEKIQALKFLLGR